DLWDESIVGLAVPPRFPRQSPRALIGLRLGSDLDPVIGRLALTCALLSVGRSNEPTCLRQRRANFDFTVERQAKELSTRIRMSAATQTTSGERSMPDMSGRRRRMGPRMGSVTCQKIRVTLFVGYGLIHERMTRMKMMRMNAWSRKMSTLMIGFIRASARTEP